MPDFVTALRTALGDLRTATGVGVIWKDADPTWWHRLPADLSQHRNRHCLAIKGDRRRLARCVGIDGLAEGDFPEGEPRLRTCPFGVSEVIVPVWVAGMYQGCCFVGPWRGRRTPAGAAATHAALPPPPPRARLLALARVVAATLEPVLRVRTRLHAADRARSDPRMDAARAWIEAHLDAGLRVRRVAAVVDLSPSRFVHRFAEVVGLPFGVYLRRRLMEEAARRLAAGDEAVGRIASDLGFASHTRFSAAFRHHAGCTPTVYRARLSA